MDSHVQPPSVAMQVQHCPNFPICVKQQHGDTRKSNTSSETECDDERAQPRPICEQVLSAEGGEIIIPNYIENFFSYLGVCIKDQAHEGVGVFWPLFWKAYIILSAVSSLVVEALSFKIMYVNSFLASGGRDKGVYIAILYSTIHVGLTLQLLCWVISKNCKLNQLLSVLAYHKAKQNECRSSNRCLGGYLPAFLVALATIISALSVALGSGLFPLEIWSFNRLLNTHYAEIHFGIFKWSGETIDYEFWNTSSVREMELSQIIIGGVGCGLDFFYAYTKFMASGIFLFSSLTLNNMMEQFDTQLSTLNLSTKLIEKNYQILLRLTKCIDGAFGNMFIVIHIENFVWTQTVIRNSLHGGDLLPILVMASRASLNYLAYRHAVRSASKVAAYRTWLGGNQNRNNLTLDASDVCVRLDELSATPIGTVGITAIRLNKQFVTELIMRNVQAYFVLINTFGRQQSVETMQNAIEQSNECDEEGSLNQQASRTLATF